MQSEGSDRTGGLHEQSVGRERSTAHWGTSSSCWSMVRELHNAIKKMLR